MFTNMNYESVCLTSAAKRDSACLMFTNMNYESVCLTSAAKRDRCTAGDMNLRWYWSGYPCVVRNKLDKVTNKETNKRLYSPPS